MEDVDRIEGDLASIRQNYPELWMGAEVELASDSTLFAKTYVLHKTR